MSFPTQDPDYTKPTWLDNVVNGFNPKVPLQFFGNILTNPFGSVSDNVPDGYRLSSDPRDISGVNNSDKVKSKSAPSLLQFGLIGLVIFLVIKILK